MKRLAAILDRRARDPHAEYLREILALEGLASFEVLDLADGTPDLDAFGCLVVGRSAAPGLDPAALERFVARGGGLVALRPPVAWDALFGVERSAGPTYRTAIDAYVLPDRTAPETAAIRADVLQSFGVADLYALRDARALAFLSGAPDAGEPSVYPAVALRRIGAGTAVLFAYDPCETAVRLRQGDPRSDRSPHAPDNAGDGKLTAGDLFAEQQEYAFRLVPQADVHQDLLVAALRAAAGAEAPLARLWHFPGAAPSVAFLSGDSDDMSEAQCEALFAGIEARGALFTLYVIDADQPALPRATMERHKAKGHGFGPHIVAPLLPTRDEMGAAIAHAVAAFRDAYGFSPLSQRTHSCVWEGYTETAEALRAHGIRLDASFGPGPGRREGFLNGSGLPARFLDREGRLLDVREQSIQYMDDCMMTPKMLLPVPSRAEVVAGALRALDACVRHHAVFQHYFHPVYCDPRSKADTLGWLDAVLAACRDRGLPFVSDRGWLAFDDARRAVRLSPPDVDATAGRLSFALAARDPIDGFALLLPAERGGRGLAAVSVRGTSVPFEVSDRLEGVRQGIVVLSAAAGETLALACDYR